MKEKAYKNTTNRVWTRTPDILDVGMTAAFLTVSNDTVHQLFQNGELPGRKVGRKWVTTKSAVLRWVEHSSKDDSLGRALERGDADALVKALNNGTARVRSKSNS